MSLHKYTHKDHVRQLQRHYAITRGAAEIEALRRYGLPRNHLVDEQARWNTYLGKVTSS